MADEKNTFMKIIDTCGMLCPAPLISTKRALIDSPEETRFEILSDNATSRDNLMNYLIELGYEPLCEEHGGIFHIGFSAADSAGMRTNTVAATDAEEFCDAKPANRGNYIVVVRSHIMGNGDDELGALLMRSCINSLIELEELPSALILYNSGVLLASGECDTSLSLNMLEEKGVKIVLCGACVDFFGIKDHIVAGRIGNMLQINTMLSKTGHVIYP